MRSFMLATVAAFALTPAFADTFGASKIDDAFAASVHAVCASPTLHRSDAAEVACKASTFPAVTATGNAFSNRGLGAEFNALIRQLAPAPTAAK